MRLIVDGADLETLVNKKEELEGLEITIATLDDLDSSKIDEIRECCEELVVEKLTTKMQMVTFIKLQLVGNKGALFSTDIGLSLLVSMRSKNYCDNLSLACRFVKGMNLYLIRQDSKINNSEFKETSNIGNKDKVSTKGFLARRLA